MKNLFNTFIALTSSPTFAEPSAMKELSEQDLKGVNGGSAQCSRGHDGDHGQHEWEHDTHRNHDDRDARQYRHRSSYHATDHRSCGCNR